MQNRFDTLRDALQRTHKPLTIVYRDEEYRVLVTAEMTVRQLREACFSKFAQSTGFKSDYVLVYADQPLTLGDTLDHLPAGASIQFQRAERQQTVEDTELYVVFSDGSFQPLNKLPAVIGRSQAEGGVDINLQDFPEGMKVSRRHAEIFRQGSVYYIRNLTQNNTLLVDAAAVTQSTPRALKHGSVVRASTVEFELRIVPKA